ncbi:GntR family transcriptional regulator [Pseudaminobacter soli (ex Li et al. 2025)]|uniref:GntR family transcriptional regulator n=1 Tax=Pseudaminobacter soli (ex Li et al. 2025) TaxID=1295366 RepID=UPI0015E71C23|nr:GntR family transcriptional regulator [Mesorhizobium soli]
MAQRQKQIASRESEERKLRYQLVYDWILDFIATNGLTGGDKLPSTTELAQLTGVSLISVRHALDKLEHAGKIHRHQGIGTFVARDRIVSEPSRAGRLLETLSPSGGGPDLATEVLQINIGLPSPEIAKALSIELGQPVWEIIRRRSLRTAPAILEQAVLPLSLVPAIDEKELEAGDSLYGLLADRYGLRDDYVEQSLEVDRPTTTEREALDLGSRDQVVRIRGVSFTGDGKAFDCYQQTYKASDFVFYMSGSGSRRLLQPTDMKQWVVLPLHGGKRPTPPAGKKAAGRSGR